MITKTYYKVPVQGGTIRLTALIMDKTEFDELIDALPPVPDRVSGRTVDDLIQERLKVGNILPLMCKGIINAALFDRYGVDTPYLSAIVRGVGEMMLESMYGIKH